MKLKFRRVGNTVMMRDIYEATICSPSTNWNDLVVWFNFNGYLQIETGHSGDILAKAQFQTPTGSKKEKLIVMTERANEFVRNYFKDMATSLS